MTKSITPSGYSWMPIRIPGDECPCGIWLHDCEYHRPERKPIKDDRKADAVKELANQYSSNKSKRPEYDWSKHGDIEYARKYHEELMDYLTRSD